MTYFSPEIGANVHWWTIGNGYWCISVGSGRTHHPGIVAGIWRLALNGIQFFAGRYTFTFNWSMRLHEYLTAGKLELELAPKPEPGK